MMGSTEKESCRPAATSSVGIKYRRSSWSIVEFEVVSDSGAAVCRGAAVLALGSVLVWAGAAGGAPRLGELALGVPQERRRALATLLLRAGEAEGCAAGLAARLSAARQQPVYVCCGEPFDRLAAPLVERALLALLEGAATPREGAAAERLDQADFDVEMRSNVTETS